VAVGCATVFRVMLYQQNSGRIPATGPTGGIMLTHDQIQQHINELDAQIPKEDAELVIWYEGDSADCEIVGN
jgi:hypothetical protein